MVDGSDDIEFEFAIGRGEKDARVNLNLFDAGTIECFEGADDASFLAGTGWAIDEKVREVTRLCLRMLIQSLIVIV